MPLGTDSFDQNFQSLPNLPPLSYTSSASIDAAIKQEQSSTTTASETPSKTTGESTTGGGLEGSLIDYGEEDDETAQGAEGANE